MTEERRRELVALVHKRMDQARVEIRAIRHESLAALRAREHETARSARTTCTPRDRPVCNG